jgi:hypothetical protein
MFIKILIANRGAERPLAVAFVHSASRVARGDLAPR